MIYVAIKKDNRKPRMAIQADSKDEAIEKFIEYHELWGYNADQWVRENYRFIELPGLGFDHENEYGPQQGESFFSELSEWENGGT